MPHDFERLRSAMVEAQVEGRGVRARDVLDAMRAVPREVFLPPPLQEFAYEDAALKIDEERPLPQPHLVALMIESSSIGKKSKVLEIGAGSGYANAASAAKAAAVLQGPRFSHAQIVHGDANLGLPNRGPVDAIFVNPGASVHLGTLKPQLAMGGRLVVSAGSDPAVRELVA